MSTNNIQKKDSILIVDDNINNLQILGLILRENGYSVSMAKSGEEAIYTALKTLPHLILMDVMMPRIGGIEACKRINSNPKLLNIPVIFITGLDDIQDEENGFNAGGVDYITKPISKPTVLARVKTHLKIYNNQRLAGEMIQQRTNELASSQKAAVYMLGEAAHYNDIDTEVHIWRMSTYSGIIAQCAEWNTKMVSLLEMAAAMHDTGKIGIPDSILKKPGKLTEKEWLIMKTHSEIGYSILSKSDTPLFRMAAEIALYHHEKWDGTGYPNGLNGNKIPESARIVAIADVFDALTIKRPYKKAWSINDAFEEIKNCSNTHFDPFFVDCFLKKESIIRRITKEMNDNSN